jgi:hypothetical protein
MSESTTSKRSALVRDAVIFQLKLMADGFRDLVLLPVSMIAAVVGLLRGGDEPEREFNHVLEAGRRSKQWINLFGQHETRQDATAVASIDALFDRLEKTVKEQYRARGTSAHAQAEIDAALQALQDQTRREQSGEKP